MQRACLLPQTTVLFVISCYASTTSSLLDDAIDARGQWPFVGIVSRGTRHSSRALESRRHSWPGPCMHCRAVTSSECPTPVRHHRVGPSTQDPIALVLSRADVTRKLTPPTRDNTPPLETPLANPLTPTCRHHARKEAFRLKLRGSIIRGAGGSQKGQVFPPSRDGGRRRPHR